MQEKLARVARDAMLHLVSRGVDATPRNYERAFRELCAARGLVPPEAAAEGVEARPGAEEAAPLLLALADLLALAAPAHPGAVAVRDAVHAVAAAEAVPGAVAAALKVVDRAQLDLQGGPRPDGVADQALRRSIDLLRALVPLADPEGCEKETALPALSALAGAKAPADILAPLDALGLFATTRRKAVAAELVQTKQVQRRTAELQTLADSVVEFLGRVLPDLPEIEELLTTTRAKLAKADARGLQELRQELTSHFLRLQGSAAPVQEQKTVIKRVLQTLAEQLAQASSGSERFERSAQEICRRLEAANDLSELKSLQSLLVQEAGAAATEASKMRSQLGELSTQVQASQQQIDTLERALTETKQAMNLDPLTRVPNRRALNDWVETTLYPPGKPVRRYSLLVLDLDHFKHVNDSHGHLAGDAVLAETAKRVKLGIRDLDLLARYGGEEFVLVLPDCELHIARAVAERMCQLVARKPVLHEGTAIPVTTSIGVAAARPGEAFREVFERADQCVYLAKQGGRNRAVTEASLSQAGPTA